MFGGLLGFLYYNRYPAKVFMGDTGSLFLGGAIAALAFAYFTGIVPDAALCRDILQELEAAQ